MALSVLLRVFFAEVSAWGLSLLGIHERILPNCQVHSGQHGKLSVNWNVTGFTFQKWRTGKQ